MNSNAKVKAKIIYDSFCARILENNWKNSKEDDKLRVSFSVMGKDAPMNFRIRVDEKNQLIKFGSFVSINIPDNKKEDIAFALCAVNNRIIDGNFDFDVETKTVFFRITNSFKGIEISGEALDYLMEYSLFIVDKYDTLLRAVADGIMTLDEFLESIVKRCGSFSKRNAKNSSLLEKENASEAYEFIKKLLVDNDFPVEPFGVLGMRLKVVGKDLEIPVIISVDSERSLIKLRSPMPFGISEKNSRKCALAVCKANFGMNDGCFEYDYVNNLLAFRTEVCYTKNNLSEELIGYLLRETFETVDRYNDSFLTFA